MSKRSDEFEQLVHRINALIERSGAAVTWNERVPDPDVPNRSRQIDVSIRRDGLLTMVECRAHAVPQDVEWIENLIGRRASLKADAVIAVSSSGFTSTALLKAAAHGIATRDLSALPDAEIANWGRGMRIRLYLVRFDDLCIHIGWRGPGVVPPSAGEIQAAIARVAKTLFNPAADLLQEGRTIEDAVALGRRRFGYTVEFPDGVPLGVGRSPWIRLEGAVWLERRDLARPIVKSYGSPSTSPEAFVETFPEGQTAIIHDGAERKISCIIDITELDMPPLSQFRFAHFESDEDNDYASLELIGAERMLQLGGTAQISVVLCE